MNKTIFFRRLEEIRDNIRQGNVSDGITELCAWLPDLEEPSERLEVLLDVILLSVACGDIEEASARWEEVGELGITEAPPRFKAYQAFFLLLDNKKKRGLSLFDDCILEMPDNYEYYLLRGLAYIHYELFEHAQADLIRANTISPNNVLVMSSLADVCAELGETERAISLHETVLEMCPDFRRSLMSLGVLYFDGNRLDESFRLFQCLNAYDPLNWFAWTCLGDIISTQPGRTFQSLPCYAAAIAATADNSSPYLCLAKGLYMLGKYRQGAAVLRLFEKRGFRWSNEERRMVRYLQLIADVATRPEMIHTDAFFSAFRGLKELSDQGTALLFQILAGSCGFKFNDPTQRIFLSQISVFMSFVQYMHTCERRVIEPEEAIMLGVIAHNLIWSGFRYEAFSLLALINRADDIHVSDMASYLWQECYEQLQLEKSTGIDLDNLHRSFIRMPETENLMEALVSGQFQMIPHDPRWGRLIGDAINSNDNSGFAQDWMKIPCEWAISDFHTSCIKSSEPQNIALFWQLCAQKDDPGFDTILSEAFQKISKSQAEQIRHIMSLYATRDKSDAANNRLEDLIQQTAGADADAKKIVASMFKAANDNRESDAPQDAILESLSGFEPLPFALDGTAFTRLLDSFRYKMRTADGEGLEYLFDLIVRRAITGLSRTNATKFGKGNAENWTKQCIQRCITLWQALNGQKPLTPQMLLDKSDFQAQSVVDTVFRSCSLYSILQADVKDGLFPADGLTLPASGTNAQATSYQVPEDRISPASSTILKQPVSSRLLDLTDLFEQFYNYAVETINAWLEDSNDERLAIFLQNRELFSFRTFDSYFKPRPKTQERPVKKTYAHHLSARYRIGSAKIRSSNTDREKRPGSRKYQQMPHHPKSGTNADETVRNTAEMARSLEQMHAYYKRTQAPLLQDEFSTGYFGHPFLMQFAQWAETMANTLYAQIRSLENSVNNIQHGHDIIAWQINDLLGKYPFLSRLYILLARLYAAQDAEDKVMQTLQAGYGKSVCTTA